MWTPCSRKRSTRVQKQEAYAEQRHRRLRPDSARCGLHSRGPDGANVRFLTCDAGVILAPGTQGSLRPKEDGTCLQRHWPTQGTTQEVRVPAFWSCKALNGKRASFSLLLRFPFISLDKNVYGVRDSPGLSQSCRRRNSWSQAKKPEEVLTLNAAASSNLGNTASLGRASAWTTRA